MILKKITMLALLAVSVSVGATPVTVDSNEWRQVTETAGYSWHQIAQVCDPLTGACNGSLGTADLTGWNWASIDEIGEMFHALTGQLGGGSTFFRQYNSTWAPAFLDIFTPTYSYGSTFGIYGWSRSATLSWSNTAYRPYVYNSSATDYIVTNGRAGADSLWTGQGAWLVRSAQPVPEPPTLILLAIGLIGVYLGVGKIAFK